MRIFSGSPKKKDKNQNNIARALEKAGCSVTDTSAIGGGFPDLVVGRAGRNYLMEVKNPETRGRLNEIQRQFFNLWRGQVDTVYTIDEAFSVVGLGFDD